MTVEEQLRETLHRRGDAVDPSPGGWTAITGRIERHQRRTRTVSLSLVVGASFAAVALAVVMVTVADPNATDQPVSAAGGPNASLRSTTTLAQAAVPTSPADGPGGFTGPVAPAGPRQSPAAGSTQIGGAQPNIASATAGAQAGTMSASLHTGAVYPETATELENTQAGVNEGHQPWWVDPAMVAGSYLGNRGVTVDEGGEPRSVGEVHALRYTADGIGGWISVAQLVNGSIYYVEGSGTDRVVQMEVVRQGDRLAVDLIATAPGKVVMLTKRPGGPWNASSSQVVGAGTQASLSVDGPASTDLIVHVRHEGDDGKVAVADQFLGAAILGFSYDGLRDGSILGPGSLGPVSVGLRLPEAARAAGVAMVRHEGESCVSLSPAGRPEGVALVSTAGDDNVDVITVAAPGVRTEAGIGLGSTRAEVEDAYSDAEPRLNSDGDGRIVYVPDDPILGRFAMVFGIVDGHVASMWSGYADLADTDEICA